MRFLRIQERTLLSIIDDIFETFRRNGDALYDGGEVVTQSQHALQAAHLAERDGCPDTLVAAALLHDYGHVLDDDGGEHPAHEAAGARALEPHFVAAVTEPGKLHVAAKRYLCATEPGYFDRLSPVSVRSLEQQGGPFTSAQAEAFARNPHAEDAVRLRRYDEQAKAPDADTPDFEHFRRHLEAGLISA